MCTPPCPPPQPPSPSSSGIFSVYDLVRAHDRLVEETQKGLKYETHHRLPLLSLHSNFAVCTCPYSGRRGKDLHSPDYMELLRVLVSLKDLLTCCKGTGGICVGNAHTLLVAFIDISSTRHLCSRFTARSNKTQSGTKRGRSDFRLPQEINFHVAARAAFD